MVGERLVHRRADGRPVVARVHRAKDDAGRQFDGRRRGQIQLEVNPLPHGRKAPFDQHLCQCGVVGQSDALDDHPRPSRRGRGQFARAPLQPGQGHGRRLSEAGQQGATQFDDHVRRPRDKGKERARRGVADVADIRFGRSRHVARQPQTTVGVDQRPPRADEVLRVGIDQVGDN